MNEGFQKIPGYKPLYSSNEGPNPLTEQEVKSLIEIAFVRFAIRNNLK